MLSVVRKSTLLLSSARFLSVSTPPMFCFQCEQTNVQTGACTGESGICGKSKEVAGLQDLLIYLSKGMSSLTSLTRAAKLEVSPSVDSFIEDSLFSTLTNVNFSSKRFVEYISKTSEIINSLTNNLAKHNIDVKTALTKPAWLSLSGIPHPALLPKLNNYSDMLKIAQGVGIATRKGLANNNQAIELQELLTYGIKGSAAYSAHARALGYNNLSASVFMQEALNFLTTDDSLQVGTVLNKCLEAGKYNFDILQTLDLAHTNTFGHPVPTSVNRNPTKGNAILVTGHDLNDLKLLLDQIGDRDIKVYTHGEMLPAHGYPKLHKYKNLVGHYGNAWYKQQKQFQKFPGSILVTTNCVLIPPKNTYGKNIFTTNVTGVDQVGHLNGKDFEPVIKRALELPGYTEEMVNNTPKVNPATVGFGHNALEGAIPAIVDAVKQGKISHFILSGGCDGFELQRTYYKNLATSLPNSVVMLTLGCAKFRFYDQDFGTVEGTSLPRLIDCGQCNDSATAIILASKLAEVFKVGINDLPLSLDLSWFEQKAVAVLLTLLHLGVKRIRLGPRLPAFVGKETLDVLVKNFQIAPADLEHPIEDIKKMMQNK